MWAPVTAVVRRTGPLPWLVASAAALIGVPVLAPAGRAAAALTIAAAGLAASSTTLWWHRRAVARLRLEIESRDEQARQAQARVEQAYLDPELWTRLSILNTARMGGSAGPNLSIPCASWSGE